MLAPHQILQPFLDVEPRVRRPSTALERYAASEGLAVADLRPEPGTQRSLWTVLARRGRRAPAAPARIRQA